MNWYKNQVTNNHIHYQVDSNAIQFTQAVKNEINTLLHLSYADDAILTADNDTFN